MKSSLESAGKESCLPGLGVVAPDGSLLHICPDGDAAQVYLLEKTTKKVLGLIPLSNEASTQGNRIAQNVWPRLIQDFMAGNYEAAANALLQR